MSENPNPFQSPSYDPEEDAKRQVPATVRIAVVAGALLALVQLTQGIILGRLEASADMVAAGLAIASAVGTVLLTMPSSLGTAGTFLFGVKGTFFILIWTNSLNLKGVHFIGFGIVQSVLYIAIFIAATRRSSSDYYGSG